MASRSRVLTDAELAAVWTAAGQAEGHFGTIVRLLILTGMRRGECAALQKSWIRASTISLPGTATKNGRDHAFPIAAVGASLLKAAIPRDGSALLFPARGTTDTPFNGWSKSKVALDTQCKIEPWTLHDLRRTFATNLAALGTPIHVTEKLLNHVSGTVSGVAAIYNRHAYMDEMRAAIDAWEKRLSVILAQHDTTLPHPSLDPANAAQAAHAQGEKVGETVSPT